MISRPPDVRSVEYTASRCRLRSAIDVAAHHREAGADRHHHIGVIHGLARAVERFERHQIVVELLGELAQHIEIGARREVRVGDVPRPIEHEAARALEILALSPRGGTDPPFA